MKISIIIFLFGLVVVRGFVPVRDEVGIDTGPSDKENLKQIKEIFQKIMQDYVVDEEGYETTVTLETLHCTKVVVRPISSPGVGVALFVTGTFYTCHSLLNYERVCKKPSSECREKQNWSSTCQASFSLFGGEGNKLRYDGKGKPYCFLKPVF
uniref:Uncharacterized protein n=1 Tax=Cuerna arida TaxID=1464854 RepID=A0A1B6FJY0_9HEMI